MNKHKKHLTERNFNRALTAAVLLAGLLPLFTLALVQPEERTEVQRALDVAIQDASQEYQRMRSLPALQRRLQTEAKLATRAVLPFMREKSALRRHIAKLQTELGDQRGWDVILGKTAADLTDQQTHAVLLLRGILRASAVLEETFRDGPSPGGLETGAARGFLAAGKELHAAAPDAGDIRIADKEAELADARAELERVNTQAEEALATERDAARKLERIDDQLDRIRRTTEEVHRDVIRMQGQLARIDAKIQSRIERELIEKGLLTPGAIDRAAIRSKPQFAWPAYGGISAGFLAPGYKERFGFPHYGLDIVIGQGSPVFSAADGVVFLARDGGQTGYSYVLVGHRGGMATLYGHLSAISVSAGQDLRQGEVIGLSGGAPGLHGSGPTTTGPHLHFEVLQNGVNVDPRGVLP